MRAPLAQVVDIVDMFSKAMRRRSKTRTDDRSQDRLTAMLAMAEESRDSFLLPEMILVKLTLSLPGVSSALLSRLLGSRWSGMRTILKNFSEIPKICENIQFKPLMTALLAQVVDIVDMFSKATRRRSKTHTEG